MNSSTILNLLISTFKFESYLEVGIPQGITFEKISISRKVGVDPNKNSKATLFLTSDEYFKTHNETFDLIFIDGLHHADQVYRDINNSLKILNQKGIIVCHDLLPSSELSQLVTRQTAIWTGDCWKAFVRLRHERNDLAMFVLDIGFGFGFILRGKQELLLTPTEDYSVFNKDRDFYLNLVTKQKFLDEFIHNRN